MKALCNFERALKGDNGVWEITFSTHNLDAVIKLKELKGNMLTIDFGKHRAKRSINANAYYWVLADKISQELSKTSDKPITSQDIYKEHIKDIGAFYMLPIKQSEVDNFIKIWEGNGIGWIIEDMGKSKLEGYQVMKCYFGSSIYNTEQMNRLINLAIADAKEIGIETMTPNEIVELLAFWGDKDEQEKRTYHQDK